MCFYAARIVYICFMKKSRFNPIVYFAFIFLALVMIQSYFLYNTVLLKKNEIKIRAKKLLDDMEDDMLFTDNGKWEDKLYTKIYLQLKKGEISQKELEGTFKRINDSLVPILKDFTDNCYEKSGIRLAIRKQLNSVTDAASKKKIISSPLIIYETVPKPENLYGLSDSKWESNYSSTSTSDHQLPVDRTVVKNTVEVNVSFLIDQSIYFDVLNMNVILFRELWILFLGEILLLLIVLWLYYLSYRSYYEQRQQVVLLHDTIDNISHEFKTPLATLRVASKQLKRSYSDDTLALMDRQVLRLEHLLKPLEDTPQDGQPVTKEQLEMFIGDYSLLRTGILWEVELDIHETVKITLPEAEILLGNLIENSMKYGSTVIKVLVHQQHDDLIIQVSDNGIGISKEEQSRIFDKYYRIPTENVHNVKGLGVGLYLVHSIVKKYKGTLEVVSDLKKGCSIKIQL